MVSYYNFKTKETGYGYDISDLLSFHLGDSYYEYDCTLHLKIKETNLEYDLSIRNFDYEKGEYVNIKLDYPTPEFKSRSEIFNFFNRLVNSHDRDFIRKLRLTIKEREDK